MATYKIIQDIESEDMILWRLSMRQLIYAFITCGLLGAGYLIARAAGGLWITPFVFISLPFLFMALPLGRDQPNDVWLLAHLNFILRSQRRLWKQSRKTSNFVTFVKSSSKKRFRQERPDSIDVTEHIQDLSQLLDSRGQSALLSPEGDWQEKHELRHQALKKSFHKALSHKKHQRRQEITQHFSLHLKNGQAKRRPKKPLQPIGKQKVLHLKRNRSRFDTIKKLAMSHDLKIAALEDLAKDGVAHSQRDLRGGQEKSTITSGS